MVGNKRILKRVLAFTVGSALAVIVGALGVVLFGVGGWQGAYSALTLPTELTDAVFISSKDGHAAAYSKGMGWYQRHMQVEGSAASFTRDADALLAVSMSDDETYLLRYNGNDIVTSSQQLAVPARAPYAKIVAYAQRIHEEDAREREDLPQRVIAALPGQWEIGVHLLKNGTNQKVVAGYAPLFIDDTQFLFFTSSGIYRYNLETGNAQQLLSRSFPVLIGPVLQSPDRTLIAFFDPATRVTEVYRIEDTGLRAVATISEHLAAPAISNEAVYDLKGKPTGAEVWRYGLRGEVPVHVYTFPFNLSFSRIVF